MPRQLLFICNTLNRASTRYRVEAYLPLLREQGWVAEHVDAPRSLKQWMALIPKICSSDGVVVSRRLFSMPGSWCLRRWAKKLVFDFDDAVHRGTSSKGSGRRGRRFQFLLRRCDEVWAGNEHLAAEAGQYCRSTAVIPTAVDPGRYPLRDHHAVSVPGFTLVWIGSSSTAAYLKQAMPVLEQAASKVSGLRLKVIADVSLHSDKLAIDNIPWSESTEAAELAAADAGLAPMPDDPWTRGKCGCKILQYMAAGLPVIASPMPVHEKLVVHGESGLLASCEEEWVEAIRSLSQNPELRENMGRAGRRRVEAHYSRAGTGQLIQERLNRLIPPVTPG